MGGRRSRRALCSTARPADHDLGDYDDDYDDDGNDDDDCAPLPGLLGDTHHDGALGDDHDNRDNDRDDDDTHTHHCFPDPTMIILGHFFHDPTWSCVYCPWSSNCHFPASSFPALGSWS